MLFKKYSFCFRVGMDGAEARWVQPGRADQAASLLPVQRYGRQAGGRQLQETFASQLTATSL